MLETSTAYTEVLLLERQSDEDSQHAAARNHNDKAGTELRDQTTTVQDVIEGKAPDEYAALAGMDTGANQLYGLVDQRLLNRLFQYAGENWGYSVKHSQQRGSCLYHSVRRVLNCPKEWTNTYLWHQIVAHIVAHVQFIFPLIAVHIQGNYGHVRLTEEQYNNKIADGTITQNDKEDYEAPGPFSLVTYLQAMLKGDFYADEITLIILSMMWQVRVTVLNSETLHQIKIRHGNKIEKVDIAVVHCSGNQYLPLGKCTVIYVFHAAICNIHAVIDVVSAVIFVCVVRFSIIQSSTVIVAVAAVMH